MRITLGQLRRIILREVCAVDEEAVMPGKWAANTGNPVGEDDLEDLGSPKGLDDYEDE